MICRLLMRPVLLLPVSLTTWCDAQYINRARFIVSLKNDPKSANTQTKTRPPLQRSNINISPVGVLGQSVQCPTNTLGTLPRHLLKGLYGLLLYRQSVHRVLRTNSTIA